MILDEIETIITWFKRNSGSNDINEKIRQAELLAINSYYLATLVADCNDNSNNLEYRYKSGLISHQVGLTGPVTKGEIAAKEQYKDLYKEWTEAENLHRRYALLLHATENIINQVRQSNSYLKNEQRNSQM